jgi:diguanylate cyclase (GGDEF)-like protein
MAILSNMRQRHVLIVEDDANTLHLMRDYLSRANFRVRTAPDGWEALRRLKDGPVDIVVSEHSVADMDGARLREKCMMNPVTRDIPFLFLIDGSQTESHVRALRSGVDDCLIKPFDPVILVAHVQAVIERRRSYEEMVRVDPLTRLLNRPALEKELSEELRRVMRYNRVASLVLIDIDSFTEVNSESGVAMGDLLLTCLSGVILTNIRVMDIAGRYHGGQFILFLPETPLDGAVILTQRIQAQLGAIANAVAGFALTFTASIVALPEDGDDIEIVLPRLEQALVQAKEEFKDGGVLYHWGQGALGV